MPWNHFKLSGKASLHQHQSLSSYIILHQRTFKRQHVLRIHQIQLYLYYATSAENSTVFGWKHFISDHMCLPSSSVWWGVWSVITSKNKHTRSVPWGLGVLILHSVFYGVNRPILVLCFCVWKFSIHAYFIKCEYIHTQASQHMFACCVCVFDESQWRQSFSFVLKPYLFWKVLCLCVFAAPVTFAVCVAEWGKPFVMFSFR